jgi:integrase
MNAEVLALHLEAYIGVREALGFQMQAQRILLQSLVQFIVTEGDGGPLRAQWALQWACATSNQYGRRGAAYRLSVARGFLRYMRAAFPDTEVPDYSLVAWPRRPQPYLFTAEQIATLTEAALTLGPSGAIRALTLATVIGVLASTGLRAGEVMRLTVDNLPMDTAHDRPQSPPFPKVPANDLVESARYVH